jgi:transcriptional regulator with PAS, ATPase and Fis domain
MNQIGYIDYPSPVMKRVFAACRQAAATVTIVLLLGESGTGKGFLARYIHRHSPRLCGPFLKVNCAAVSKELAESELFGHERGAFTGAVGRRRGLLELANGGTLLLDELGDMDMELQSKFLSFLEDEEFMRVGGEKPITADARLIAATNRNLEQRCDQGLFRRDLYYRVNVFPIWVPALRNRKKDIPLLARDLLCLLADRMKFGYTPDIDLTAIEELTSYDWPGNVRELRNILERTLTLNYGQPLITGKLIISAMNQSGELGHGQGRDDHPAPVEISDEQLKRMIEEVFGDSPTPVEVVRAVLGWKIKKTSAAVRRMECRPGEKGRLPKVHKTQMIAALRQWLVENGFL